MPYAMFYAWIYLFYVVLVSGSNSVHAFHVYGLIYMFFVSLYAYFHACAKIYRSLCLLKLYAMLTCLDPCVYAYVYMSICLGPCLHMFMSLDSFSHA